MKDNKEQVQSYLTRRVQGRVLGSAGFTLIEMILYITILAILIVVLSSILTTSLEIQSVGEATSSVTQDGRFILIRLSYDLGRASQITTPANLGDTGNSLQILIDGVNYIYVLDGNGNLQMTDGAGTDNLNSSETKVANLNFEKVGNVGGKETIIASFKVESRRESVRGTKEENFRTTIGLR